jgi:hypothetical protein
VDDDTVWDPQITYERIEGTVKRTQRSIVDDQSTLVHFTGPGWQALGIGGGNGNDRDQGYLPGRIKGTLMVSGRVGDKMMLKFHGKGVELLGDTGSDRGTASITLDGKSVAILDTFVPERSPDFTSSDIVREPTRLPIIPPIRLWGIQNLNDTEHTLELTVTGQKNKESTGTFIGVDAVLVLDGLGTGLE